VVDRSGPFLLREFETRVPSPPVRMSTPRGGRSLGACSLLVLVLVACAARPLQPGRVQGPGNVAPKAPTAESSRSKSPGARAREARAHSPSLRLRDGRREDGANGGKARAQTPGSVRAGGTDGGPATELGRDERAALASALRKIEAKMTKPDCMAADESVPSEAVSWGASDASEWYASCVQPETAPPAQRERGSRLKRKREASDAPAESWSAGSEGSATSQLDGVMRSKTGRQETTPRTKKGRQQGMERPAAPGDEEGAARYHVMPDGSRQQLVTRHDAKAGRRVRLSALALDEDLCDLSDYFRSRYQGLVGELVRPWDADALAWWVRFPGHPEDIFSTGGTDGFHLAYAPGNASVGAVGEDVSALGAAGAKAAAKIAALAGGGSAQARRARLGSLLRNASEAGDLLLLSAAVAAGADVNLRVPELGNMTLLHEAIVKQRSLVAARLIALRASTKAVDHVGAAALHHAAVTGDVDIIRALLDAGASASQVNQP
jgi:hypothetical protein